MTNISRLDHVAVLVADTEKALEYFSGELGLPVVHAEVLESISVRLTYLDAGNVFVQLLEPLDPESLLAARLRARGEGLDHICFGVADPLESARRLAVTGEEVSEGSGRGRIAAFAPGLSHGVRVEFTESS